MSDTKSQKFAAVVFANKTPAQTAYLVRAFMVMYLESQGTITEAEAADELLDGHIGPYRETREVLTNRARGLLNLGKEF